MGMEKGVGCWVKFQIFCKELHVQKVQKVMFDNLHPYGDGWYGGIKL